MPSVNWIGLWTLTKREIQRTMQIINQAIWPPLISTLLFFFVFGVGLGSRIHAIDGVPYLHFLVPGLIAMNVIESSYGETTASLFQGRFMGSIQELLVAPLSYLEMVLGYVAGSILRAFIVGNLIMIVGWVLAGVHPQHWFLYFATMGLLSVIFSSLGLILALFAETFDQLAFPTTFFITPLVYFGGVFTSVHMLPAPIQTIARLNPIYYLIDALRTSVTGSSEAGLGLDAGVGIVLAVGALSIALAFFRQGKGLRT